MKVGEIFNFVSVSDGSLSVEKLRNFNEFLYNSQRNCVLVREDFQKWLGIMPEAGAVRRCGYFGGRSVVDQRL